MERVRLLRSRIERKERKTVINLTPYQLSTVILFPGFETDAKGKQTQANFAALGGFITPKEKIALTEFSNYLKEQPENFALDDGWDDLSQLARTYGFLPLPSSLVGIPCAW